MDWDKCISNYNDKGNENRVGLSDLEEMTKTGKHPVFKQIRRQLIFESLIWICLLFVYYDIFDGQLKSLLWNILLVCSLLLLLIHNILGYVITKTPINANTIKHSLKKYLQRIKKYARISIVTRVIAVTTIVLFLTSNVNWDAGKYWYIVSLLGIIAFQIYSLNKIWSRRKRRIEESYKFFSS